MAIGSPGKTQRLDQLRTFARVQVRSGYITPEQVRAEVHEAVRDEESDRDRARQLAEEFVADAERSLAEEAASWPSPTGFERLTAAFEDMRAAGIVVLEAVEDHWTAHDTVEEMAQDGRRPRGVAYFTHPDIWHCIENGMLELNVWHGDTANVAEGEELLTLVCDTLARHGLEGHFDEGRVEVTVEWQRRPRESGQFQ